MRFRINYKKIGITMILSLALATIVSMMLSNYWDIPVLKTGPAFIVLLVSVFIIYLFVALSDGKIDKTEIFTMIFIALALLACGWALKSFFPEIFSALPDQTKELFSSLGV